MNVRILILSAVLLFVAQSVMAQAGRGEDREPKTPEERAQKITDRMSKKLSLSDSQKESIYAINLEHAQKNDDLRAKVQNGELDREGVKAERLSVEKSRDEQITALLTEEQMPIYEEMKEKAKQKAKDRMQNRRGNRNQN